MGPKFKVGDTVRRVTGSWHGVHPGDAGVVCWEEDGSFRIRGNDATFDSKMFVLDDAITAAPSDNTKPSNPKDSIGDTKVPLWLLSPIAKAQWAVGQFVGMCKYGAWNWRIAGVRASVYLSAMQRHMDAYTSGEDLDPSDGTPHLGHIMACCAILIDAKEAGKLNDDRPPSVNLREAYAAVEAQMAAARLRYADKAPYHYTIADTVQ